VGNKGQCGVRIKRNIWKWF